MTTQERDLVRMGIAILMVAALAAEGFLAPAGLAKLVTMVACGVVLVWAIWRPARKRRHQRD